MFTSITEYQQQLLIGNTTCVATVNTYLENIGSKKQLNAFTEVFTNEALVNAAALDEERLINSKNIGRLHGVVIAIKDVICYKDHSVTAASKILEGISHII